MIPRKLALSLYSLPVTHGRLRVIEHNVYITLALPKGPLEVTQAKNETNSSKEFKSLLKRRREQWPERDGVPRSGELVEMITSKVDGREDFKRNFILFVMSTCINGNQRGEVNYLLCYLDRVVFNIRFGKGALEDQLDDIEVPDEGQEVHEEGTSNATPEPTAEAEHDTIQSKIKALLEDAKKQAMKSSPIVVFWQG
ncbi:hypothetical protein Cgig2_029417 [Carnegiea gigantea]|uniref:Uncharacterized protein n=1 Tax=Carnegiea gigantea TaxID=171969 RepID=A0A9Q1GV84_9CARY|nr:hypothetical protein Cgig2_029417 [Carnegiea gigantea]